MTEIKLVVTDNQKEILLTSLKTRMVFLKKEEAEFQNYVCKSFELEDEEMYNKWNKCLLDTQEEINDVEVMISQLQ